MVRSADFLGPALSPRALQGRDPGSPHGLAERRPPGSTPKESEETSVLDPVQEGIADAPQKPGRVERPRASLGPSVPLWEEETWLSSSASARSPAPGAVRSPQSAVLHGFGRRLGEDAEVGAPRSAS